MYSLKVNLNNFKKIKRDTILIFLLLEPEVQEKVNIENHTKIDQNKQRLRKNEIIQNY